MDAISFDIKGIKCDNKACGWSDMTVAFEPEKYLNAPCPMCGSNLFTQADYDKMKKMFIMAAAVNRFAKKFHWLFKWGKRKTFEVNMNGSGKTNIKETK